MSRVVVVGLGPADAGLVTPATTRLIADASRRFLRTTRHPAAEVVPDAVSFDEIYERADSFDDVYAEIVERLVAAADEHGEVLYAVPGSPLVLERAVERLRADDRVETVVHPAMSFLDVAWARLGIDPVELGVRLVDGHRFAVEAAGERGPMLVAHTHARHVLSDIKLAVEDEPERPVLLLQRLGLPDEHVAEVAWADLDRSVDPDHLTCLWIPELAAPIGREVVRLWELSRTLREECPWDREQTHRSLRPSLIEEAHEVLEAIDALGDDDEGVEHLEEELGDLLFQVMIHSVLAAERGAFDLSDVARGIHDKLYSRHPHVFGDVEVESQDAIVGNWERIKRAEKSRESLLEGIPAALPALQLAAKVLGKIGKAGIAPADAATLVGGLSVEVSSLRDPDALDEERLGELLLTLVTLSRVVGVDAEAALRASTARLGDQFRIAEALAREDGIDLLDAEPAVVRSLFATAGLL
ncbi:MAG: MazG family protein [Actinomycetota bacterium]